MSVKPRCILCDAQLLAAKILFALMSLQFVKRHRHLEFRVATVLTHPRCAINILSHIDLLHVNIYELISRYTTKDLGFLMAAYERYISQRIVII